MTLPPNLSPLIQMYLQPEEFQTMKRARADLILYVVGFWLPATKTRARRWITQDIYNSRAAAYAAKDSSQTVRRFEGYFLKSDGTPS